MLGVFRTIVEEEERGRDARAAQNHLSPLIPTLTITSFFYVFLLCSFVIGQAFLSMLCAMKWGVFLFFAGFCVLMTIFIYFLLPETKGVGTERIQVLFARHPIWKRVMGSAADDIVSRDHSRTASRKALAAANGSSADVLASNGNGKNVTATKLNGNGDNSSNHSY